MCECLPWQRCEECAAERRSAASAQTSVTAAKLLTTLETFTASENYRDVVEWIDEMLARGPQPEVRSADVGRAMAQIGRKREGL